MIRHDWPQGCPISAPKNRHLRRNLTSYEPHEEMKMTKEPMEKTRVPARRAAREWHGACKETWWSQHREASLNWLALGLLLAAWNASDNDPAVQAKRRPGVLRGYSYVSVRAQRSATSNHVGFTQSSRDCKG
jgi:hypothetical protein